MPSPPVFVSSNSSQQTVYSTLEVTHNALVDGNLTVKGLINGVTVGAGGSVGPAGPAGTAATLSVGSTTTLAAGTSATVTNSGNYSSAILNFGIPQGLTGATGATGPAGPTGTFNNTSSINTIGTITAASIITPNDVRYYGAVGNGVADDTVAIQNTINNALSVKGMVYLPKGTYKISSTLTVGSYITIQGENQGGTIIQQTVNAPCFTGNGSSSGSVNLCIISDLTLNNIWTTANLPSTNTSAHGIVMNWGNRCVFSNLSMFGCYKGYSQSHGWQNELLNLSIVGQPVNFIGIQLEEYSNSDTDHNNVVQAVNVMTNVVFCGFRLINYQGSKFVNCEAAGSGCYGWYLGDPVSFTGPVSFGHFSNCLADTCLIPWYIQKGIASKLNMFEMTGCWCGTSNASGNPVGPSFSTGLTAPYTNTVPNAAASYSLLHVEGASNFLVSALKAANGYTNGIYLNSCTAGTIAACNVDSWNNANSSTAYGLSAVSCTTCTIVSNTFQNPINNGASSMTLDACTLMIASYNNLPANGPGLIGTQFLTNTMGQTLASSTIGSPYTNNLNLINGGYTGYQTSNGAFTTTINNPTATASHSLTIPDNSGTIALTSQLPISLPWISVSWTNAPATTAYYSQFTASTPNPFTINNTTPAVYVPTGTFNIVVSCTTPQPASTTITIEAIPGGFYTASGRAIISAYNAFNSSITFGGSAQMNVIYTTGAGNLVGINIAGLTTDSTVSGTLYIQQIA